MTTPVSCSLSHTLAFRFSFRSMYYYDFMQKGLLASLWIAASRAQSTITVTASAKAAQATNVSQYLNPSFAGMGIEPSNLFSFTGGQTANSLSINLLANLANYSGAAPHLRIGGNTGDYMIYESSYSGWDLETNTQSTSYGGESGNAYIFGPRYLEALDRFTGCPITYGLNMGYTLSDYLDQIVIEAAAVLDNLNNTKFYSFEIGNEPDLYLESWNLLRNGTWDGTVYTQEFLDRAAAVYDQVLKPRGISSTHFEAAQTASTIGTTFTIDDLDTAGIAASVNGSKYLSSWNQHDYFYFVDVSTYVLTLEYLMNFDNTETQFKYWTSEVTDALATGLPYNLREMASAGPTGIEGISDTFGASLWTLNFFCYAASLNISSVQLHMTDNSYAAPWAPITKNNVAPHVRPSYYAYAAFAQLLGSGNETTQISTLDFTPSNSFVRAYAAYAEGVLSSLILLNAQQVNASETTKENLTFTLSLPAYEGQKLYISRLTADGADSTQNATWNGISFEQDNVGTATVMDSTLEEATIGSDGAVTINVRDSQAVIAKLGSQVESGSVATPSASATSSSGTASSTSSGSGSSSTSKSGARRDLSTSGLGLVCAFLLALAYAL